MISILEEARAAISRAEQFGIKPTISLFFKNRKWPKTGRTRLFGRNGGPSGECVLEKQGGLIARFSATEVVEAIEKTIVISSKESIRP